MANNSSSSSSSFDSSSSSSFAFSSSSSSNSSSSSSESSFGFSSSSSSRSSSSSSSVDSSSSSSSSYLDYQGERMIPFVYTSQIDRSIRTIAFDTVYAYAGTSDNGMILRSRDRYNWEKFYQLDDRLVTSLLVNKNTLFAGTSPNGLIYRINLINGEVIIDNASTGSVADFVTYNGEVYVAFSSPATIYRFDAANETWRLFYKPYGKTINQMSSFLNKIWISMDAENMLSYDENGWNFEVIQPDNTSTSRRVSKNVFSHVSYDFINTKSINTVDGFSNEDVLDIFPRNRLIGIGSFSPDGVTVTVGGKNFGRVFNYYNGKLFPLFDTDSSGVQCLLNIDTGANLAAMGNKLYLIHCGDITPPEPSLPIEPTPDPNEGKTVIVAYPNGGETLVVGTTVDLTWTSTRGINDAVKLSLYKGGSESLVITERTSNDGTFPWNIPLSLEVGADYQIYIEWLSASSAAATDKDLSDGTFSLAFSAIEQTTTVEPEPALEGVPDISQCRGIPIIHFNNDEMITYMTKDSVMGGVLFATSFGRILYADEVTLNAYRTGERLVYADATSGSGFTSDTVAKTFLYALYKRIAEINNNKEVVKCRYMEDATAIPVENVTAVFVSPVLEVQEDIGFWKQIIWSEEKTDGAKITVCVRAGETLSQMQSESWKICFRSNEGESSPITRELNNVKLEGKFAQIRVEMETNSTEEVVKITNVNLIYSTKRAQYFYSTKFSLENRSDIKKGLITGTISQPTNTEITFGYNASNSTDWDEYTIIELDKFFSLPDVDNIKVGIRMVSYDENLPVVDEFALLFSGDKINLVNQ